MTLFPQNKALPNDYARRGWSGGYDASHGVFGSCISIDFLWAVWVSKPLFRRSDAFLDSLDPLWHVLAAYRSILQPARVLVSMYVRQIHF